MYRSLRALTGMVAALGLSMAAASAQEQVSYAVTTTNISVGHAAQSSLPVALGLWEEEGLDVDVLGLSGATAGVQQVASGRVDFATVGPESLLMAQAEGIPVKAVYVFARRPIYRIVSPADSDLTEPEQLDGKVIGVPNMSTGSVPFTRAVLKTAGIDPESDVQWLAVGLGAQAANAFRQADIDVWASWDTAVAALENGGFEFQYINPPWISDLFGNVMIAHENTIRDHPDWVVKVARGIARASVFGLHNPEAAIRAHWKAYPETAPEQQTDESLAEAEHIFNARFELLKPEPGEKWGESIPSQWNRAADLAIQENLIPADFDVSNSYTNEFVDDINDFDEEEVKSKTLEP